MNRIRTLIFWLHLVAGVVAGVVIFVMSATGAALAFEKQIIAWAERDARRIQPVPTAEPLTMQALLAKARESQPEARPTGVTLFADPSAAVMVNYGRTNAAFVHPFTGEVRAANAPGTRRFMQTMLAWHRYLGASGERRPLGKAVTGACNAAFLFLGISGLYLWWPRKWAGVALRAVTTFNFSLRGKARDWNWHNVIGFWSAPVLIVLTATALPISYRWAGHLIYTLTGTPLPAENAPPGPAATPVDVPQPPPGAKPLGYEPLLAAARDAVPDWKEMTLNFGRGGVPGGGPGENRSGRGRGGPDAARGSRPEGTPATGNSRTEPSPAESSDLAPAVTVSVKRTGSWPRTATTTLTFDPYTGAILRREGFADLDAARQVRSWTRFLHTGEALGWGGQFVAGAASLGGVGLVWTGLALSWRRFFRRSSTPAHPAGFGEPVDTLNTPGPS